MEQHNGAKKFDRNDIFDSDTTNNSKLPALKMTRRHQQQQQHP